MAQLGAIFVVRALTKAKPRNKKVDLGNANIAIYRHCEELLLHGVRRKGFAVVALVNDAARAPKKHGGSHAASLEIVLMHGDLVRRELRLAPMRTPLPCAIFRPSCVRLTMAQALVLGHRRHHRHEAAPHRRREVDIGCGHEP